jgi:predicted ester cyclase
LDHFSGACCRLSKISKRRIIVEKTRLRTSGLLLLFLLLLTACQPIQRLPETQTTGTASAATSLEEANKALVKRVYEEIMNQKNLSAAGELFSPNLVIHQFDPAGEGLDLGLLITALPDLQVTVERLLVEGDLVTALVTFSGTHQAEFLGVAPTGNPVTFSLIDLLRVQDGKIAEVWHNIPLTDILHQMQSGPNVITGSGAEPSATAADLIRSTERERLRAMVEADMEVANQLHADDFQLINPGGGALSKAEYLGFIASGDVDYLVWEPISEIAVRLYGANTAVIRYQSQTDIVVFGEKSSVQNWHTDLYEQRDGQWQVVWSQATTIQP